MRWLFFLILSVPSFSHAEYRAFLLKIVGANGQDFRLVKSNLDPEQYPTYYPLRAGEKIQYTETWMCRGRTNESTEICDNPRRTPALSPVPESGTNPNKGSDSNP